MNKKLFLLLAAGLLVLSLVAFFTWGTAGTTLLWNASQQGTLLLPLVAVSALIDSINPCAFSILLLTIAFLLSLGNLRSKILTIGAAYIAGIFLSYMLIGLGLFQTLHLFDTPHFMAKVGAFALLALGSINIVNQFFPAFPIKLQIPRGAHRLMSQLMGKTSLPTAFLLGGLVGICEFPCTGGPYLMVLGLLHDTATYLKGFAYLLLYNVIFVLPLAILLFIASDKKLLEKVQTWQQSQAGRMRLFGGLAMIALGLLILVL